MLKSNNNLCDVKTSTNEVFAYFAIPVEAFQAVAEQQTASGVQAITHNLVIKTLADGNVQIIDATDVSGCFSFLHVYTTIYINNTLQLAKSQNLLTLPLNKQTNRLSNFVSDQVVLTNDANIQSKSQIENGNKPQEPKKKAEESKNSHLKCSLCKETFEKTVQYRKHMLEHRNAKKFKCDHCNASYNMEDNFKLHMAIHSKGPPCCPLCERKFQRLASLKAHLIVHQVDEMFSCIKCLAEFEKEEDLEVHMESHEKEEVANDASRNNVPLVCTYCNYTFEDAKLFKEHVSYHVKVCNRIFIAFYLFKSKRPFFR